MSQAANASITRRSLVAGFGVAIPAGACLAAGLPTSAMASGADADLIEIGRQFDEAHRRWAEIRPTYDLAVRAVEEAMQEQKAFLTATSKREGEDGFFRELCRIHDETGMTAAEAEARPVFDKLDRLADETFEFRPQTLPGIAVQARVLAYINEGGWEKDEGLLDWNDFTTRRMIECVLALVGMDRYGRTVA